MVSEAKKVSNRVARERLTRIRRMIKEGKTRAEISRHEHISPQRVSQILGPMESRRGRKEQRMYVDPELYANVVQIAASFGLFLQAGKKAGGGSVPKLIEGIGSGKFIVTKAGRNGAKETQS